MHPSTVPLRGARPPSPLCPPFKELDNCHEAILDMLRDLEVMARGIGDHEITQCTARQAHLFFTNIAFHHHVNEEKHVFPALLARGQEPVRRVVLRLQEDHTRLAELWLDLAPHLHALARGYHYTDASGLQLDLQRFIDLYQDHIALENTLVYPSAQAILNAADICAMSRDMAGRQRASVLSDAYDARDLLGDEADDNP